MLNIWEYIVYYVYLTLSDQSKIVWFQIIKYLPLWQCVYASSFLDWPNWQAWKRIAPKFMMFFLCNWGLLIFFMLCQMKYYSMLDLKVLINLSNEYPGFVFCNIKHYLAVSNTNYPYFMCFCFSALKEVSRWLFLRTGTSKLQIGTCHSYANYANPGPGNAPVVHRTNCYFHKVVFWLISLVCNEIFFSWNFRKA